MKTNELMIGDKVYCHHPSRPKEIVTVNADLLKLMERIESGIVTSESPLYRIIEPIPFTPEILEKNFPNNDDGVDWWPCGGDGKGFYITIKGNESTFMGKIINTHELQHALRLCGIDKEIVINT